MRRTFLLLLCLILAICLLGCESSATLPSAEVRYHDGAAATAEELKSVSNSNDTLEIWHCTSAVDIHQPDTKLVIEETEISGVYARLILDKIQYLTSKTDLELGEARYSGLPQKGNMWIKLSDGSLYSVGKAGVTRRKDIYSSYDWGMKTESLRPIVESALKYSKTNASHYRAYYKQGKVSVEHIFNHPGDVTMTVKDMYYMDTADIASITVELVSKTDREIRIELRYYGDGHPTLDKKVSLKKGVPKTVVLEFEPSSEFKNFTLKCDENVYEFIPFTAIVEITP